MLELRHKNKEIDIQLKYYRSEGKGIKVSIYGEGDLSHHLIEGLFAIIDKLSTAESCSHTSREWKEMSDSRIKARMKEINF